jgi:hypothetical protein
VLVVFDRPEICAAPSDDVLTQGALAELGIAGDGDAPQIEIG